VALEAGGTKRVIVSKKNHPNRTVDRKPMEFFRNNSRRGKHGVVRLRGGAKRLGWAGGGGGGAGHEGGGGARFQKGAGLGAGGAADDRGNEL